MRNGSNVRTTEETAVGLAVVGCATIAAHWGVITGDALVGVYASVLGYVFGRVRTATQNGVKK